MAREIPEIQRLKEKYPQYQSYPDTVLLTQLSSKYPKAYGSIAAREFGGIGEAKSSPSVAQARPSDQEVVDYQTERFADRLLSASIGAPIDDIKKDRARFEGLITRAPRAAFMFTNPIATIAVETVQQGINALVSNVKKEEYSPLEFRMVSEMMSDETPMAVKLGVDFTEAVAEAAFLGAAGNLAKQGLLKKSMQEIGKKLEQAGYGTGEKVLDMNAIKQAAKGSTLEAEAARLMKAKKMNIPSAAKPAVGASTTTTTKPPTAAEKTGAVPNKAVDAGQRETPAVAPNGGGTPTTTGGATPPLEITPASGTQQPSGKTKPIALSKHILEKAVEEGLVEALPEDVPQYLVQNRREVSKAVLDIVEANPSVAIKIAMGEAPAPQGINPEDFLVALERKATIEGDYQTILDLSMKSSRPAEATQMGQRLRALRDRMEGSPVSVMNSIINARKAAGKKAEVTKEEAEIITKLSGEMYNNKIKINPDSPDGSPERLAYGMAAARRKLYVSELMEKSEARRIVDRLKSAVKSPHHLVKESVSALVDVGSYSKALIASIDNSVVGRQGLKVLTTHPSIWYKNSLKTYSDIYKVLNNKDAMLLTLADVLSRKNALNGNYKKYKLDVGVTEEHFPTSSPGRIPVIGRLFRASEAAFTGFQYKSRADIFDKLFQIAQESGADPTGIGKLANSLTGRGTLGKLEPAGQFFNNVFFSPRLLRSHFDTLTAHAFSNDMGSFARKQAGKNTITTIAAIASVLAIAKAFDSDSVELDSTSADFGKIKSGNTRFDVTGGMGSIAVLASRMLTQSSKSSTTGISYKLNTGEFGSNDSTDVFFDFFQNKLSPISGAVRDKIRNRDFEGNRPTVFSISSSLMTPIIVQNYLELKEDPYPQHSANIITAMLLDFHGLGMNNYYPKINWDQATGKEINQFREQVGDEKFMEANQKFNDRFNEWFIRLYRQSNYKNFSDDEKKYLIQTKRKEIKKRLFNEYGFKYVSEPSQYKGKFIQYIKE